MLMAASSSEGWDQCIDVNFAQGHALHSHHATGPSKSRPSLSPPCSQSTDATSTSTTATEEEALGATITSGATSIGLQCIWEADERVGAYIWLSHLHPHGSSALLCAATPPWRPDYQVWHMVQEGTRSWLETVYRPQILWSRRELSFSHNTISLIVRVVSIALFEKFAFEVISCPTTAVEWQVIADMFATRWQFLHTQAGTLDGKHIAIRCLRNGGSLYYNYKVWEIY